MSQIKIYGLREQMMPRRIELSDAIHDCVVRVLRYPVDKRAHRFIPLEPEEFIYPPGRSERYTILEISMFEGRSIETKKELIRELYRVLGERLQLAPMDLEITIFETPRHNWGIRGLPGDELDLNYKVEV